MFWFMTGLFFISAAIDVILAALVLYWHERAQHWQYRYENELEFIRQHFTPETD